MIDEQLIYSLISSGNYNEFHKLMKNNNKLSFVNDQEFVNKVGFYAKNYDHLHWLKEIPGLNLDKILHFKMIDIYVSGKITNSIEDVKSSEDLHRIYHQILDKYNEDEINNILKKLPNYDSTHYKNFYQKLIYHIIGLYLSWNKKYTNAQIIEKIENMFNLK